MIQKQSGFVVPILLFLLFLLFILIFGVIIFIRNISKTATPSQISSKELPVDRSSLFPIASSTNISFKDKDIPLSFSYPNEYSVEEEKEEDHFKRANGDIRKNFTATTYYEPAKAVKLLSLISNSTAGKEGSPFVIWIFENPNNLSVGDFYKNYWYYPYVWGEYAEPGRSNYAPLKEATVSGRLANYAVIDYRPGTPNFYYLPYKDKMLMIRVVDTETTKGSKILEGLVLD